MKNNEEISEELNHVAFGKGTEPPFSGKYVHTKDDGTYACAVCNVKLFSSDAKFDSGSGWPSFGSAIDGAIKFEEDRRNGMVRTEVLCAGCGAHLGHRFQDGPTATGTRLCINSVSLDLKEK